jgi:hypothetical protein
VPDRLRGTLPSVNRRPVSNAGGPLRAHRFHPDQFQPEPDLRRRVETAAVPRPAPAARIHPTGGRVRHDFRPAPQVVGLREVVQRNLLTISAALLFVGAIGWCLYIYDEFRTSVFHASPDAHATLIEATNGAGKSDSVGGFSSYVRTDAPLAQAPLARLTPDRSVNVRDLVARDFGSLQPMREASAPLAKATKGKPLARVAAIDRAPPPPAPPAVKQQAPAVPSVPQQTAALPPPQQEIASLGTAPTPIPAHPSANIEAKTSLIDFETAPFPYEGMSASGQPFLNAGRHVNFRGRVFYESKTFSDDHVLLHIPAGFDPSRPAVMVVFFHGHGAILARDVRDRQRVPEQISAAGSNAVLVAPQFAVDAADSSAGKFWEADGFKRFLDEAAQKLATLYGNPRAAGSFANMPVVIVAYSGGFGPLLSVLAHGGVRPRIRGLVLLDALYGGFDQFADWIAANRSTFFVSSYTPYTARHNAELEHLLDERGVAYSSELRSDHLRGTVTFLPAGNVMHRDFVTHAWADNPLEDILVRMDDVNQNIATAGIASAKRN